MRTHDVTGKWIGAWPPDATTDQIGLVFEVEGHAPITIRISRENALDMAETVTGYLGPEDDGAVVAGENE